MLAPSTCFGLKFPSRCSDGATKGWGMGGMKLELFAKTALECSVYIKPKEPGLTHQELEEVGRMLGFLPGETRDAINASSRPGRFGAPRIEPTAEDVPSDFNFAPSLDFRSVRAFDYVDVYLRNLARSVGKAEAKVLRAVLVSTGVVEGLPENDVEIAITLGLLTEHLAEKGGLIQFAPNQHFHILASEQIAQSQGWVRRVVEGRQEVYEAVKNVIERRTDGRASSAEPLVAFEQALAGLGHQRFLTWWSRTRSELGLANDAQMPMTVCVLSAALSEGALTFIVKRARALNVGPMGSKTFEGSETQWKFDDLLKSAASGGRHAILDQKTRDRADRLNSIRQRIHVGRLMAATLTGPIPDTRPEEAREARETLDVILRRILDWLDAHPEPQPPSLG